MAMEAALAGKYKSPWGEHARIQLLTIRELLAGRKIDYPRRRQVSTTYRQARRHKQYAGEQLSLEVDDQAEYIYMAEDGA
jgi:hypothetical protein